MNDSLSTVSLARAFAAIGADIRVAPLPARRRARRYTLDVVADRRGRERFVLAWDGATDLTLQPLHVEARRHLLLLVKLPGPGGAIEKHRYLCGHDERHWFAATVPSLAHGVTTVERAMEALKPAAARVAQEQRRVPARRRQDRSNPGYIRQGEWFFIPVDDPGIDERLVRRDEPLPRGGKAHRAEWAFRRGGQITYVSHLYPRGVSEGFHRALIRENPALRHISWRVMRSNPEVYCRGHVRHPDHATVHLPGWHRVLPNTEGDVPWREQLVFLD